ncbi:nitrate- and nitrite sensing domain-containing protein [Inhella sp. 1Y17]|uniref:Nitrate- and nitrite sensing domain-containing protein n=2 Tax=Inhella proteolytica TaxID=2795029 RepID=A0A931IZQ1_9BURK|nr:nitrate- and nitrite sensing domain-containing protein [Inhella proteolytica]
MLALPSARLLQGDWRTWQVAEREAAGIAPATELLQWVRLTQQHRGLSAGLLAGDGSQADARSAKQAQVQASAERVLAALAPFEPAGLPQRGAELQQQAQSLMQAVAQRQLDGSQSLRRHSTLIDQQLRLLQDLAQTSGLAQDAQPALLNLQAGVLTQLPRLTEQLGQLRARGTRALGSASIGPEDRARIEAQIEQAQQLLAQGQRAFDLAIAARPRELAPLAIPLAEARQAALAALALSHAQLVEGQQPSLKPATFYAQQTQQIDRQFALMDRALELLREQVLAQARAARQAIAVLLGSLLLLSGLAGWILWRVAAHTSAAIGQAVDLARAVAQGDLRGQVDVDSRDETGQLLGALQRMNEQLTGVVAGVRQNADGVATAATQIAQGNQDLSNRTEQQASALEQTAASMEQLGATVRQNAAHAQQANQLALGTADMAQRGGSVMQQVVQTMHGIQESSRRIEAIIGVIDGIAFQTNILALNAAVEAARAGEQGRGFAVVASEVRALAQRSADAAREIKGLIDTSVTRVEHGNRLVDEAGQTIAEVVQQAERLRVLMAQISTASAEQSSGVQQVGQAVSEMDRVTQQNAALVEQSAAAAESLQQQAQQLVDAVAVFRLRLR